MERDITDFQDGDYSISSGTENPLRVLILVNGEFTPAQAMELGIRLIDNAYGRGARPADPKGD